VALKGAVLRCILRVSVGLLVCAAQWSRRGGACHAGEARAFAAATRRMAASPQTCAAGQPDAIAILMRRTLMRTSAPILSSLRRMVPQPRHRKHNLADQLHVRPSSDRNGIA